MNMTPIETTEPKKSAPKLGTFSLGVLAGAAISLGTLLFSGALNKQPPVPVSQPIDLAQVREAARQGAMAGIAEQLESIAQNGTTASKDVAQANLPTPTAATAKTDIPIRMTNMQGSPNAPVTIVEYSDYGCGYCAQWHEQEFDKVVNEYVKTGKVRIVYKHMISVGGDAAYLAAQASECAAKQNNFWAYHDVLFAQHRKGDAYTTENLVRYATELNMDTAKFTGCLNNKETEPIVQADMSEAAGFSFRGTPSFMVNGAPLIGAQPFVNFKVMIDKALGS